MSIRTRKAAGRDSYMELIQQFPLRPIRSETERDRAGAVMDTLAVRGGRLDAGESDYLDVLSDLIEAYDARHWPMPDDKRPVAERLRHLMEQCGMNAKALAELLGCSPALVSLMLAGKRELSKVNVLTLSRYFKLDAAYLL